MGCYWTNHMMPITLRHFTESRFLISIIIGMNSLFGFIAQPYVAWKSDQVRTRFGRRKPFLLLGMSGTLICVPLLGLMPTFFQGSARHAITAILALMALNLFLQAFQDVNWGAESPLYADSFDQDKLGRATAFRAAGTQGMFLVMSGLIMPLADRDEIYPYLASVFLILMSLLIVIFVVREPPAPRCSEVIGTYRPLAHASLLLRRPAVLKVAIVYSLTLTMPISFNLFLPLVATETLGLSKGAYGIAIAIGSGLGILLAWPGGWLVDRIGAKYVAAVGFLLSGLASVGMLFIVEDHATLCVVVAMNQIFLSINGFAMLPLIFEHAAPEERGKVFGLVQFIRAFSAFSLTPLIGCAGDFFQTYLVGYVICVPMAVVGMVLVLGGQDSGVIRERRSMLPTS